jgi:murein DD-endopeptidase MepM/ murein hydrolase activator NlpD
MRALAVLASALLLAAVLNVAPAFADSASGGTTPSDSPSTSAAPAQSQGSGAQTTVTSQAAQLAQAARGLGRPTLHRGSRGVAVRTLQRLLTDVGYRTRVTGVFDLATQRQVQRFQRANRLEVDGTVGPMTGATLRRVQLARHPELANVQAAAPPSTDGWVFPIRGAHNYGTAENRYGAPRSGHTHQGQDVMASCGLQLVAAHAGKVVATGSGGAAGNYIAVHTTDTRFDYFYAHLRSPAVVSEGATVSAGQLVGYVGDTGDATACHLHFELWDGPWWNGGHTIDPLPYLRSWDH